MFAVTAAAFPKEITVRHIIIGMSLVKFRLLDFCQTECPLENWAYTVPPLGQQVSRG